MKSKLSSQQVLAANTARLAGEKHLSQPKIAALAKSKGHPVDQNTISRAMRVGDGATKENCTLATLDAIAAAFDINPWLLLVPENVRPMTATKWTPAKLDEFHSKLNEEGQTMLMQHAELLVSSGKYCNQRKQSK